jgi:hypothetical protein
LAASALLANLPANAQEGLRADRSVPGLQLRGGSDVSLRGGQGFRLNGVRGRQNFRGERGRRGRANRNRRNGKRRNVNLNGYGQTRQEVKFLADKAIYACACQLEVDANKYGFKDGVFRSTPHYEQIGPNKFIVKGAAKLYDGYNYTGQAYDCEVKRGSIKHASNLYPANHRRQSRRNRRNNNFGFRGLTFSFGNQW